MWGTNCHGLYHMEISGKEVNFLGKEFHDLICIKKKMRIQKSVRAIFFISHGHVSNGI